jgi:hypothetical protein
VSALNRIVGRGVRVRPHAAFVIAILLIPAIVVAFYKGRENPGWAEIVVAGFLVGLLLSSLIGRGIGI